MRRGLIAAHGRSPMIRTVAAVLNGRMDFSIAGSRSGAELTKPLKGSFSPNRDERCIDLLSGH